MNEVPQNPFDPLSLATGDGMFGREDEMAWLLNGIQEQARLLLFGGEGMGKSSLLGNAGAALTAGKEGWMIRLDLSLHRSTEGVVDALRTATGQVKGSPVQGGQPAGFGSGDIRPGQKPDKTAGKAQFAGSGGASADLLRALGDLNAFALRQKGSVAVAFDACHEMSRFGGEHLEHMLMAAVESHSAIAYILSGDEHGLKHQPSEGLRKLQGAFKPQSVGRLDGPLFANWIDARFQSSSIVARGVGAACVNLADGNTAQTVELAQRSFALSLRAGFANEATVQSAFGQAVAAKTDRFAHLWEQLSENEQSVLRAVAKTGGRGLLELNSFHRCGLKSDDQTRTAVHSLVNKRLLDPAGPTGVTMPSAAMKQWTLQANIRFGRQQTAGEASAQQLSFSFNFHRSSSPAKSRTITP